MALYLCMAIGYAVAMTHTYFCESLLLGFSIALPIGPIAVLCIRRTLEGGMMRGVATGLGAASADACYATLAALGTSLLGSILLEGSRWFNLLGGTVLCVWGLVALLSRPKEQVKEVRPLAVGSAYVTALMLTLANPMTILAFCALFVGAGFAVGLGSVDQAMTVVAGVFCGSMLWWLLLSVGVSLLCERIGLALRAWLGRISGLVLLGYGLRTLLGTLGWL